MIVLNITIDECVFEATLKEKLGNQYEMALGIFRKIGNARGLDSIQILLHAVEKNKEAKIIADLEKHTKKACFDRFDLEEINNALENAKKELEI